MFYLSVSYKNIKITIYGIKILPVVLCGFGIWSLTSREERRLRVLRRIFVPVRDEVRLNWLKLINEELNDLYPSPNIIRVIKS
jgi:hypothetical protein